MNPAYSSIALAVFSLLSLFLFPCFLPARSFADTPAVTPSITIGNSGTLAFSVDPGSFAYGSQDITVLTTNYTGYTLTAVPSSNDPRLANSVTGSYISSIASNTTQSGFSANEYGFSTDTTIDSSTTYHPLTASTVIKTTNAATTTAQAGTFQLTIGAKAGSNAPAGTYSRTFTMTASANAVAYAVTYVENAGQDTVSNMPDPNPQTTGTVVGATLTLSSARPTRSGYTFLGWATTSSAEPSYQPGGSYSLDQTTANAITLYAIWVENMQTWAGCGNMSEGASTLLADSRDGNTYTIAKLGGQCWMTQNLRITGTIPASGSNFSGSDFNVSQYDLETDGSTHCTNNSTSDADPKGYQNVCSKTGVDDENAPTAWYNFAATSAGSIAGYNNNNTPTSDICPSGWRIPSSSEFSSIISLQSSFNPVKGGNYNSGSHNNISTRGFWWSSTASNSRSHYNLRFINDGLEVNDNDRVLGFYIRCVKKNPTHTLTISYGTGIASVTVNGQSVTNNGTITMEEDVPLAINMTFDSGFQFNSWSATSGTLGSASTQSTTYTIGSSDATLTASAKIYMQNLTASQCSTLASSSDLVVHDSRDENDYTVRYLGGQCWMTQNLRITGTIPASGSNFTGYSFNVSQYDLTDAANCSSTFSHSCHKTGVDIEGNPTAWYNYYAATAGTIYTRENLNEATSDICPSGWRLPTNQDKELLRSALGSDLTPFKPVATGWYGDNGELKDTTTRSFWWTSTPYDDPSLPQLRKDLKYDGAELIDDASNKYRGFPIRCVKKNPTHTLTVSYGTGVASVTVNGQSVANNGTVTMEEGVPLAINMTFSTGYEFNSWSATSGALGSSSTQSTTYTIGNSDATLTANAVLVRQNQITLTNTNATTTGTQSVTATYGSSSLAAITNPQRSYTFSGFSTSYNNASGATITGGTSTRTYTYSFAGWYTSTSGGTLIIDANGNFVSSTSYTDSNGNWIGDSDITLYAQWASGSSISLPSITKNGYNTCGWGTSTSTTTITYNSGATITNPTASRTLYGVCKNVYNITLNRNGGTSGSTSTTVDANATTLKSITRPSRSSFTISGFTKPSGNNASGASVSSTSSLAATNTFNGWYKESSTTNLIASNATTPVLQANTTYTNSSGQWTYTSGVTLYAGWTTQTKTLPTITRSGYVCGWTTTSTGATSIMYSSGETITPTSSMTLYGVCLYNLVVTGDSNLSSMTLKKGSTSGTTISGTKSGNTVTFTGLENGTKYYLYPVFNSGYEFSSWAKTDSVSGASLGSTSSVNTYYTVGSGNGALTLTSKASKAYMQSFTKSQCQSSCSSGNCTVYDSRDEKSYNVRYINGNCWMTSNLRFTGTSISSSNTNINTSKSLTWYNLVSNGSSGGNCYGSIVTPTDGSDEYGEGNGWTRLCKYEGNDGSGNPTVWYNYAAATAGTITGSTNTTNASYSICPSGWKLPSSSQMSSLIDYKSAFSPVTGGAYANGSAQATNAGVWWTNEAAGFLEISKGIERRGLWYSSDAFDASDSYNSRHIGLFIRCVRSS